MRSVGESMAKFLLMTPASDVGIVSVTALTESFKWRRRNHHDEAVVWHGYCLDWVRLLAIGLPRLIQMQRSVR